MSTSQAIPGFRQSPLFPPLLTLVLGLLASPAYSQLDSTEPGPFQTARVSPDVLTELLHRLQNLETEVAGLRQENQSLDTRSQALERQNQDLRDQYDQLQHRLQEPLSPPPPSPILPVSNAGNPSPPPLTSTLPVASSPLSTPAPKPRLPHYVTDYDNGFVLVEDDHGIAPFRLKLNLWNLFRFTGFTRDVETWTDNAGVTRAIDNRTDFEIVRGRLIFTGFAFDPRYNYYVNIDYNTVRDDTVNILAGWLNYKFSENLDLYFGKGKVQGSREWKLSSLYTQGGDRTLATTFFRPSFSTGVWAIGKLNPTTTYEAMIANGFNTAGAGINDLDENLSYSGDLAWEPLGTFGLTLSDLEWHEEPVIRLGTSGVTSRQTGRQGDVIAAEETFIRLSDGTNLTEPGALGPGALVNRYQISLWAIDAALKYRGWSLNGEYYFRWLNDIQATAPISDHDLFDHGFYAQTGYFVLPERLELFARTSQVYGQFGNGGEFAGGMNWFFQGRAAWRFTFDATWVENSPAQQVRTDYQAGARGMLFRAQVWSAF